MPTIEDVTEEQATGGPAGLLSPPRGWPACFSAPALKSFIASELAGRRVRLSEPPPAPLLEQVAALGLAPGDSLANALKVRAHCGWEVIGGFALYERAAPADGDERFVGVERWWNANAKGLWLDMTPRPERDVVLVESARTPVPEPTAADGEAAAAMLQREAALDAERQASDAAPRPAALSDAAPRPPPPSPPHTPLHRPLPPSG